MDATNRRDNTGEPDARKRARPVRRGAGGKGPSLRYLACGLPDTNLTDALYKLLQQHQAAIEQRLVQGNREDLAAPEVTGVEANPPCLAASGEVQDSVLPSAPTSPPSAADLRRQPRAEEAQRLHHQGWTVKAIAAHLNLSPKTIGRSLDASLPLVSLRRSRTGRLLEPSKPYLLQRWNEGCHNAARLCREIQSQGFPGHISIVRAFIAELRHASGLPPGVRTGPARPLEADPTVQAPTLRALAHLVVRDLDSLDAGERQQLRHLMEVHPKLASAIELAREFTALVRQRQGESFDAWLERATDSNASPLRRFAVGLRGDDAAVRAALSLPWSNGPTEGYVNKLKCVKRQMYGRAKLDLLRHRLLAT